MAEHLYNSIKSKETISVSKHVKILQSQATFYNTTIDTIRRESPSLEVVLSSLAELMKR